MSLEIFRCGFVYGNQQVAADALAKLNKEYNFFESVRWELARRGGLTFRQLCAIFGGVSHNKVSATLNTMRRRGHVVRTGCKRNYLWMLKAKN